MITAKLHHNGYTSEIAQVTGFSSLAGAAQVMLQEGWARITLMAHNVCVLAADDGSRLILQQKDMVYCPECDHAAHDFTPDAECIGWLWHCAGCELYGKSARHRVH